MKLQKLLSFIKACAQAFARLQILDLHECYANVGVHVLHVPNFIYLFNGF